MQVSNVFSLGRFGAYFKKHLIDNYRFYSVSVIVLAGLLLFLLLLLTFNIASFDSYSNMLPFFVAGMFIAGAIFTSLSFSELSGKPQGIDYLLFPASHLEKFLTTMLVTTVGFLLVYHLSFYIAFKLLDVIMSMRHGRVAVNDLGDNITGDYIYAYYSWFIMHAIVLAGAIYFRKYSLIKVLFCLIVFLLALYLLNGLLTQLFFHNYKVDWRQQVPFIGLNLNFPGVDSSLEENNSYHFVFITLPSKYQDCLLFIGKFLVAPILWTIAYFRLRDKEI
jgi:hypothetical protein